MPNRLGCARGVRDVLVAALLSLTLPAGSPGQVRAEAAPVIAVAANVQFAMEELAAAFTAQTGLTVKLTFGSSGNFSRQIRQGAPYELFVAADEEYVVDLARDGFARDEGVVYAVGRLVLIVPHGSPLKPDGSLDDLAAALRQGRLTRFAIANPEHAPYGQRAAEALRHKGLWEAIEPRLVFGENVSQAAQFATSGNAQGGIVAYSLALAPRVSALGSFELIPEEWHAPLNQRMAVLQRAGPVAEQFYAYLRTPAARAIFTKHGFIPPGEDG